MFTEKEKRTFNTQNYDCFIPGYTGYCPSLKFQYGRSYGFRTREILKDIHSNRFFHDPQIGKYREEDYNKSILKTTDDDDKDLIWDYSELVKKRAPPYITGYTGFVPTLEFRYGKSYGRAVDDSIAELAEKRRRIDVTESGMEKMLRSKSTPQLIKPIRNNDEVTRILNEYVDKNKFKAREISPENPPIAGYTGHIPKVTGNEESLSHSYNTTVRRGLTLLKEEKAKSEHLNNTSDKVLNIIESYRNIHQ